MNQRPVRLRQRVAATLKKSNEITLVVLALITGLNHFGTVTVAESGPLSPQQSGIWLIVSMTIAIIMLLLPAGTYPAERSRRDTAEDKEF